MGGKVERTLCQTAVALCAEGLCIAPVETLPGQQAVGLAGVACLGSSRVGRKATVPMGAVWVLCFH